MEPIINLQILDFPCRGREMIHPNEDGSYTIFINARLSDIGRLEAYEHAMGYILNNDFDKFTVQSIESAAHSK